MRKVNLDAMILREDFCVDSGYTSTNRFKQINIMDLKSESVFQHTIRKPDFQRETRDWNVEQVINFLRSIINRHFIPAVILWQNANALTFVIDGAHRISALMAWVNDDYGDGVISAKFFNNQISDEQKAIAKATRTKIDKEIDHSQNIWMQLLVHKNTAKTLDVLHYLYILFLLTFNGLMEMFPLLNNLFLILIKKLCL